MYNKKVGSLESHGMIKELDKQLKEIKNYELWNERQDSYKEKR